MQYCDLLARRHIPQDNRFVITPRGEHLVIQTDIHSSGQIIRKTTKIQVRWFMQGETEYARPRAGTRVLVIYHSQYR